MTDQDANQEPFARISVEEAKQLIDSGEVVLIDVREQWEWDRDRIPEARLVPLARILSKPQEHIKGEKIIFHCEVGQRSAVAAEIAAALGVKHVYNMEGGLAAWRGKGLPTEK